MYIVKFFQLGTLFSQSLCVVALMMPLIGILRHLSPLLCLILVVPRSNYQIVSAESITKPFFQTFFELFFELFLELFLNFFRIFLKTFFDLFFELPPSPPFPPLPSNNLLIMPNFKCNNSCFSLEPCSDRVYVLWH
jgi:hypothetical protein